MINKRKVFYRMILHFLSNKSIIINNVNKNSGMEIFVLYENYLNLNRIFRDCVIRRVYINYIQSKKCD